MLKSYIRIAWRNIAKYPFHSLVTMTGLFSGIAFVLMIGAFAWGELEVNRQLQSADRQFILTTRSRDNNFGYECASFGPLARRLKETYPGLVANYYRFDGITSVVSRGERHIRENIQIGDSTLLTMYGFALLNGNAATALNDPVAVVITKAIAIKYFGRTDVVGQTLNIQSFTGESRAFQITGVLKDIPDNSVTHLVGNYPNSLFIPTDALAFFGRQGIDNWNNIYIGSYIQLQKGKTARDLEMPIRHLIAQNGTDFVKRNVSVVPVALTDYYLQKDNGLIRRMLISLSFIGLFILLMAIVNYINMAISRSAGRMREIGIRKVMGGVRNELTIQFLTESIILVSIATLLAICVYPLLRPFFSQLVGREIVSLTRFPIYFIFIPPAIALVIGVLAGFYPAVVLSSFKAVDSLKGKLKMVKKNILFRRSLIGFQFSIALIVFIATTIVSQQVSFFFNHNLGYDKEFVLSAMVPRDWSRNGVQKMVSIRNEFSAMPQIRNASISYEIPDGNNGGALPVYSLGQDSLTSRPIQVMVCDENYLSTYQISLKAGFFFDSRNLDSGYVVLNNKAAVSLGLKTAAEAVGQRLRVPGSPIVYTIKGVTDDFQFGSMQKAVQPILFFSVNNANQFRYLSFRIQPGNIKASIEAIQKKWTLLMPNSSFDYVFMNDTLKQLYASEIQIKNASYMATLLTLIIALLGIVGLVSINIQKRTKEIGTRKVLGATAQNIMALFIKEFVLIILVAAVLACPLGLLISQNWLSNYAYQIKITPAPFLLAISGLGAMTILLVGLQTLKTSLANPAQSLKSE